MSPTKSNCLIYIYIYIYKYIHHFFSLLILFKWKSQYLKIRASCASWLLGRNLALGLTSRSVTRKCRNPTQSSGDCHQQYITVKLYKKNYFLWFTVGTCRTSFSLARFSKHEYTGLRLAMNKHRTSLQIVKLQLQIIFFICPLSWTSTSAEIRLNSSYSFIS